MRLVRNRAQVAWLAIAGAISVGLAFVPVATSANAVRATTGVASWAYGFSGSSAQSGATSVSANGTGIGPQNLTFQFSQRATFGWHVLLTQTNDSSGYEIELQRTMAFSYAAVSCYPSCSTPTLEANISSRAVAVATAFANVTSTGSVWQGSHRVPALALVDEHAVWQANLTDRATFVVQRAGISVTGSQALSLDSAAHAEIAFVPALGLVPVNLTSGAVWNSSSVFHASGAWSVSGAFTSQSINGTPSSRAIASNGSVNGSGSVAVSGRAGAPVRLDDGSEPLVVLLGLTGPFSDREGLILLPAGGDLFAGGHAATSPAASIQTESTANIDYAAGSAPHLGLDASATAYAAAPAGAGGATGSGLMPATGPSPPASVFQGQPETVAQARQGAQCLAGGPCPSVGGRSTAPLGAPVGIWGIGVVSAAAVAVIGLIAVRRRPVKLPRAVSESPLSPLGAAAPDGDPVPPPSRTPPAAGPDPLDRLW